MTTHTATLEGAGGSQHECLSHHRLRMGKKDWGASILKAEHYGGKSKAGSGGRDPNLWGNSMGVINIMDSVAHHRVRGGHD